jgi:DNA-directed RNA polymerase specialized sigma subunit
MVTTERSPVKGRTGTSQENDDRGDSPLAAAIANRNRLQDELYVRYRGELSREYNRDGELLSTLKDEALSLEERVDHEKLAECVRTLMKHLPKQRDREVLERFYLREEPRTTIRQSLQLTELQFNQVLWRARKRFGDILRRHGVTGLESTGTPQATSI